MFDSARVENAGPSMQRYVPPFLVVMPNCLPRFDGHGRHLRTDRIGKAHVRDQPSPKKVEIRPLVRSKN